MRRLLAFFILPLLLCACSGMKTHTEVEKLNEAKAVGSPFTQRLTQHYKALSQSRQRWMDYADGRHFAKKGLLAAEGKNVLPEPLSNWHLDEKSTHDLRAARNELMGALNAGGRAQAPFEAADAQGKFDCWIEQQEQSWLSNKPVSCRIAFDKAMAELKDRMVKARPVSVKAGEPIPEAPKIESDPNAVAASMDEGMFLVFFDFDRSLLNESGNQVVSEIAAQAKARKDLNTLTITGHADTSGSDQYNQRLSMRRAEAVKAALVISGIKADLIKVNGMGESSPMVATPNNTREPANRRAEIRFE